jgi:hypothetical protein
MWGIWSGSSNGYLCAYNWTDEIGLSLFTAERVARTRGGSAGAGGRPNGSAVD